MEEPWKAGIIRSRYHMNKPTLEKDSYRVFFQSLIAHTLDYYYYLHNGKFRSRRNDNGIFRTIKKWNIPYTKEMESSVHLGNGIFRKEMIYKHILL